MIIFFRTCEITFVLFSWSRPSVLFLLRLYWSREKGGRQFFPTTIHTLSSNSITFSLLATSPERRGARRGGAFAGYIPRGFFSRTARSYVGRRPKRLAGHLKRLDRNRKPPMKSQGKGYVTPVSINIRWDHRAFVKSVSISHKHPSSFF